MSQPSKKYKAARNKWVLSLSLIYYLVLLLYYYLVTFTFGSCKWNQWDTRSNHKRSKYMYTHTSPQHVHVWPGAHVTDRLSQWVCLKHNLWHKRYSKMKLCVHVSYKKQSMLSYYTSTSCLLNLQATCTLHVHTVLSLVCWYVVAQCCSCGQYTCMFVVKTRWLSPWAI